MLVAGRSRRGVAEVMLKRLLVTSSCASLRKTFLGTKKNCPNSVLGSRSRQNERPLREKNILCYDCCHLAQFRRQYDGGRESRHVAPHGLRASSYSPRRCHYFDQVLDPIRPTI